MLYFANSSQEVSLSEIGGKAYNLKKLTDLGFKVPDFVVIKSELYSLYLKNQEEGLKLLKVCVHTILTELNHSTFFAVRSSCADEDGNLNSYAGQFETRLFVKPNQLEEAVIAVWNSANTNRVNTYRQEHGIVNPPEMAVVIQEMIDSDVSGVAFGANPVTGNRNERVVAAVFGIGEGIVSGELNADNYYISNGEVKTEIATKTHALRQLPDGGTQLTLLPTGLSNQPTLSVSQLLHISHTLLELKKHFYYYQDVEFAFKNNEFYLLQTRPVTTLSKIPDCSADYIVWDNSNIIESYPGVSTPLTFSFILKVYEAVYKQFSEMMGISAKEIEQHKEVYANMLGFINGRVYYNLKSWYKILSLLPGYSLNAEFMEKMMGVKEKFELKDYQPKTKFQERLRVLNMVRIMIKNLRALPAMRKDFQSYFNQVMKKYETIELDNCNATELLNLYYDFEQTLLKRWKAPLVNDFFAMIYFGVMQKMTAKIKTDNNNLHNDLLCGERNIISTEPIKRTIALAIKIQQSEPTKQLFLQEPPTVIIKKLKSLNPSLFAEIENYIQQFGERCVGELKLETITYKQEPLYYFQILKSYIEQGVNEDYHQGNNDLKLRANAETEVAKAFKGKWLNKMLFQYFLNKSRDLVSSRENLRFERTRAFGMIRKIFLAIGKNFQAEGILTHYRDIFYLTKEEIFDYIKGTSVNYNLKELVLLRKQQFETFKKENTSERIKSFGITYLGNSFEPVLTNSELKGELKGIGCCAGRVKAKVRVVTNPYEVNNLNGDILVTSSTDPGWVTLFPTASAILVERGSLLSHSAIVSREMGKPCIVGITGLLSTLKTGDWVEMDGQSGEIKIILQ